MNGGIPGDSLVRRLEDGERLWCEGRVLQPGMSEALDDAAVELGVGRRIDDRAAVVTLEVDRVDTAEPDELCDELVGPACRRVQLEAEAWVERDPAAEALGRRRLAQP